MSREIYNNSIEVMKSPRFSRALENIFYGMKISEAIKKEDIANTSFYRLLKNLRKYFNVNNNKQLFLELVKVGFIGYEKVSNKINEERENN